MGRAMVGCHAAKATAAAQRVRCLAAGIAWVLLGCGPLAVHAQSHRPMPEQVPVSVPAQQPAHAQPSPMQSVSLPDDGMARRVLACTACHGPQGRATQQGYFPRIAGKPAGYLFNQLLNFRDGRRSYPQMGALLEYLSDDYLREMAGHFSGLQLPYPPPPAPQAPPSALERGRVLVRQGDAGRGIPACVQCHGAALTGVAPSIPGLLGLPRDYINSQLGAWTTGQRRAQAPDCMAHIARTLQPEDVSALSAWLAAQPVTQGGAPARSLPAPLPLPCGGVAAVEVMP